MIENPQGGLKILKNKPVTNRKKGGEKLKPEDITQIQPQKLAVSLRSGVYFISNPDFMKESSNSVIKTQAYNTVQCKR